MRALKARADALLALDRVPAAVEAYKAVLGREKELPSFRSNTRLDLPYLIAERGLAGEYDYALGLLVEFDERPVFPMQRFQRYAAWALIHASMGDPVTASEHARLALEEAQADKSGFRYHQSVGLVDESHAEVVRRLEALVV